MRGHKRAVGASTRIALRQVFYDVALSAAVSQSERSVVVAQIGEIFCYSPYWTMSGGRNGWGVPAAPGNSQRRWQRESPGNRGTPPIDIWALTLGQGGCAHAPSTDSTNSPALLPSGIA